ncbi:PP2C family protein-serine/threonine phosphatase [Streptomyces sp. NPDC059373]
MTAARLPKVAGINPPIPTSAHTPAPTAPMLEQQPRRGDFRPVDQLAAIQDRLASWISDLTTLHELTERLAATSTLEAALSELLRAGGALLGARRGLAMLEPADLLGPDTTVGFGLGRADLGTIETVPAEVAAPAAEIIHADLLHEAGLDPRHREVAAHLGFGASYSLRLSAEVAGALGSAVWFYDEPAQPVERQRHLAGLYCRYATEHLARLVELARARTTVATLRDELLPTRLPRVPGVRLAARHRTGPRGGGDWYDALPLPEGALGLAVGGVTGSGPSAVAAMGRLRASLRAYAVMEGEDPVAVLSDLELLLRLTEPARAATALFGYAEPELRKVLLAGAGHCPPLVVGDRRVEFLETSLSAPLGMLSCWEAPSAEFEAGPGETLLLYTDGLLHRTGEPMDRALARLHAAAASAPRGALEDPGVLVDHVLHTVLPGGLDELDSPEDVVLLAARFD